MSKRRNRWQANMSPEDATGVADVLDPNRSMLVFVGGLGWIWLRRWVAGAGRGSTGPRAMSKPPAYIICSPWDEHTARAIRAPGATRDHCTVCRVAVAVSPSAFLHALTASVLCFTCAMERMRADGDAQIMPVNAAQLAELRAVGIDTTAKHLDRMARAYLDRWVKKSS